MDRVSKLSDSILFGTERSVDRDRRRKFPKGMESFVIQQTHCQQHPIIIPVMLAVQWSANLIRELQGQRMAEGDFLLVSAPKSGTHWTWEIMSMLARGTAVYSAEPKHSFWLEFKTLPEILSAKPTGPRVLNTHQTLSQLPPGFRQSNTKTIVCMRNPKDVLVSMYYHFRNVVPKVNQQFMPFNDMFDILLHSKYAPFGQTLDHYADAWDNHKDNPNVLIVFYEDLKEDTVNVVQLMADHMGISYTKQLIEEVSAAIDIRVMKQGKYSTENRFRSKYGQDASLYRKGEIGDWKNHFSSEQNRRFDKIFKRWNKKRAIPFRFEPSLPSKLHN